MKKNLSTRFFLRKVKRRSWFIMKNIVLLLFVFNLQIYAEVTSQNKVTMHLENASLLECIKEIERQTDLGTFYNYREVRKVKGLNVKFDNETIENALSEIFKGTKFTYSIRNNVILVSRAPEKIERVFEKEEKFQQAIKVTGQIVDEEGTPIPGASVVVKSIPTIGVMSDVDGNYSIDVPPSAEVLVYSFVGMITREITIAGQSVINITLEQDILGLEEVVVVGYGIQNKERIGSSISEIKSEEIEQKSVGITSFESMLGGSIKGVQVAQGSSAPGSASVIRVRGITSPFSGGNNQPLYVIDGVEFNTDAVGSSMAQNPLESVSPSDIKSITVLKDAGATAIYGSRGANGVIIVTTKRGRRNSKLKVTFDASYSMSNPQKTWDLLNSEEFKQLHQMIAVNTTEKFGTTNDLANLIYNSGTGQFNDAYYDLQQGMDVDMWGNSNTDWQKEVYNKNAPIQKYNLTFFGGTESTNYAASIYSNSTEGLMINDYQDRYGSRLSVDTDVNDWMRLGTSINVSGAKNFAGRNTTSGFGPMTEALRARPDWAVIDEYGNYIRQINPDNFRASALGGNYTSLEPNPVASTLNRRTIRSLSVLGNAYLEIEPLKNLKLKSELNVVNFTSKSENFLPIEANHYSLTSNNYNSKDISHTDNLSTTLNFQGNYMKIFGDHVFDIMAGLSSNKIRSAYENHNFSDMGDDTYRTNIDSGTHNTSGEGKSENVINSWYSRLQYSYKGKYTITANMRSDKSSKFGPGNKRGYFPSGAISWNIAQENFMHSLNVLDKLKLRASYGKTGLANISDFTYLRYWSTPWNAISYMGENVLLPEDIYPNEDIKWETTRELNIGIDFALFSNRLYGGIDYYDKYTDGAIMETPVFSAAGAGIMYDNRAEISNTGMEFDLGGDIIRKDNLTWSVNFNIAYNRNILESIEGNAISQWVVGSYVEGEPVGVINGQRVSHIIQDQAEIDALNAAAPNGYYQDATTGVGDYLYIDTNEDGQITSEDRVVIGSQEPDFFGGFSTNLTYKQFSLTAGFQYSVGNEKDWQNADYMYLFAGAFANMGEDALYNTWTENNKDAKYPMLTYGNRNNSYFMGASDSRIQDASYLRLKVVNLSYRLPKNVVDKLHIDGMVIYVGATNLLTFTKYEGLDPEGMSGSYSDPGDTGYILSGIRGADAYPMARTYTMGIKLTF